MIGCIIQARMGSSRLPGKVMMKIQNRPIIDYVVTQVQYSKKIKRIVLATTKDENDDVIVDYANEKNISIFRGKEGDVLDRFYQCAKHFSFSAVVRITSDNPLIDPEIIDEIVTLFETNDYDYVSNDHPPTFPLGYVVEVFSFSALETAWKNAVPSEREHVTDHFWKNKQIFKQINYGKSTNLPNVRCTLDTEHDYNLIKTIVQKINHRPILFNHVLKLFENEPELFNINKHVKHG